MSLRTILLTISLAVTLAGIPQVALAATTYADTVAGRELFATPTLGIFAGTATGQLPGSWYAAVQHTPLDVGARDELLVGAGAFVPAGGAAVVGFVDNLVAPATDATKQKAAQQKLLAVRAVQCCVCRLPGRLKG